jgi:predicted phosphohydrolase
MIHHPPLPDFAPLLKAYDVEAILYGHVHLSGKDDTLPEDWMGLRCICVAADRLSFTPRLIATIDSDGG